MYFGGSKNVNPLDRQAGRQTGPCQYHHRDRLCIVFCSTHHSSEGAIYLRNGLTVLKLTQPQIIDLMLRVSS